MKKSRLLSILLAMIMVLTMSVPAFAEGETTDGTITVDNAVVGQTYTIYQILDLESYNKDKGTYAYKATDVWEAWLKTQTDYVTVDAQGYVTWVTGADAAAFAKAAKAYAAEREKNGDEDFHNQGSETATSTTVTFTGLDLGYYLMDSTLGVLCSLNTTNPFVVLKEKNTTTVITKEVQEDSTGSWGATNDADINQTINFHATITAYPGAENYVMHDKMSAGLTFDGASSVKITGPIVKEDGSVEIEELQAEEHYTVIENPDCDKDCTFHVEFDQDYLDTITAETDIVVEYTGKLNENAKIALEVNENDPKDEPGNPNDVGLTYGDNNWTGWDRTVTYTWDMNILKYGDEDTTKVLSGAKFVVLNSAKTKVAKFDANGKLIDWYAVPTDNNWSAYELTTDANGEIHIEGLDADQYFLRETVAPAGYNKLADDIVANITSGISEGATVTYTTPLASVNNNSGSLLPDTGGIGTTILYVLGGLLVVGAAAALIARRRTA